MGVSQTLDMHRAAYMAYHGELKLKNVWHICHEGLCVNPKHLPHKDHQAPGQGCCCGRVVKGCVVHDLHLCCDYVMKRGDILDRVTMLAESPRLYVTHGPETDQLS